MQSSAAFFLRRGIAGSPQILGGWNSLQSLQLPEKTNKVPTRIPARGMAQEAKAHVRWLMELDKVKSVYDNIDRTQFNSGDKDTHNLGDLSRLRVEFRNCEELLDADPNVLKLCSMEYGTRADVKHTLKFETIGKVNRYVSDLESVEAAVARLTVLIRSSQLHIQTRTFGTHDARGRAVTIEMVQKRQKYLSRIRQWDYNKFAWLLETLNLTFTPKVMKRKTGPHDIYRHLVQNDALTIRRDKFVKLHNKLKSQQDAFLVKQERELAEIEAEETAISEQLKLISEKDARFKISENSSVVS